MKTNHDKEQNYWKPNLAITISVLTLLFSIYQFFKTSGQFHSLNDPVVTVDDAIMDTSFGGSKCKVAVLFSNHGNTAAKDIKVTANLRSKEDIPGIKSKESISGPVIMIMAPHDSKIVSGLMDKKAFDFINVKNVDVFLNVDISYENFEGNKFNYTLSEKYDVDYKKFLVISSSLR